MRIEARSDVAVVGCGAMGAGIAQLALLAGHRVLLRDLDPAVADSARSAVLAQVDRQVARGRVDLAAVPGLRSRLVVARDLSELGGAALVVEAVAESLEVKLGVLGGLETVVAPDCILATNTSSLSIDQIAAGLDWSDRFVGMHFFNPAAVMRLVEVVRGAATSVQVVDTVEQLARAWGKEPVVVRDSPGFVVNRVARAYYGESLRLLDDGRLDPPTIDRLLRAAGFPMGPCELMDLIGHDISLAATTSVWEATDHDLRYAPSRIQQELVRAGRLGRKTGRGFHVHPAPPPIELPAQPDGRASEVPAGLVVSVVGSGPLASAVSQSLGIAAGAGEVDEVVLSLGARIRTTDGRTAAAHAEAAGGPVLLVDRWTPATEPATEPASEPASEPTSAAVPVAVGVPDRCEAPVVQAVFRVLRACGADPVPVPDVPGLVVSRVVSLLVDEANDVVGRGVATPADVDRALQLGAGYPRGPLAWGDLWGASTVVTLLDHLRSAAVDPTYRVSGRLRSHARAGRPLSSTEHDETRPPKDDL